MESTTWKENMWYEFAEREEPVGDIIDNNENVDVDQYEPSSLSKIKQTLQPQIQVPKIGDFVLVIKSNPVFIGNKEEIKTVLTELIYSVDIEKLKEDDIIVFQRANLEHIFE